MAMVEMIHMTAEYSNAVLVAVLPHISTFAAKLELPIPLPITPAQVARSRPFPVAGYVTDAVWLTNGYWFVFHWHGDGNHGFVSSFSCPTNMYRDPEAPDERLPRYAGPDNMTTNAALALARQTLLKIGLKPEVTHANETPSYFEPSWDIKRLNLHIPFCQFTWEWESSQYAGNKNTTVVTMNLNTKSVAGLDLVYGRTNPPPKVEIKLGVEPVLEKDWRRSQQEAGKK